jgi:hypothetical protein
MSTTDSPSSLSLAFSQPEDRLLLIVNNPTGPQNALFLTRRLTALFINGAAGLLTRSSAMANKVTDEVRNEILLMEHQGALPDDAPSNRKSDDPEHGRDEGKGPHKVVPQLIDSISIKTNPTNFQISLKTKKPAPVSLTLNRRDLHRVLELLKKKAENAGWNLQIDVSWLDTDMTQLTLN